MASVNMFWRTLPDTWVNNTLPFVRHTGPALSLCHRNHTPNLPKDFKELAYLVSSINSMPYFDGCIVPTPQTRLKWSPITSTLSACSTCRPGSRSVFGSAPS
eukprot:3596540-Rhodomonas_salina.1